MKTIASITLLTVALACTSLLAAEGETRREIMGLRLDMTKEEAQKRLKEIGTFVRPEKKQQEVWEVKDKSFSHVIVGFEKTAPGMRYITAVAREDKDAERVRYSEVGSVDAARQAGDPAIKNFNFEWTLAAVPGHPEMLTIARGRDPEFLSTLSLKRTGEAAAAEDNDEE